MGGPRIEPTDEALARLGLTRERFEEIRADHVAREARAPKIGDPAPEFELPVLGNRERTVRLSDYRDERPVALVFGSYT